MTGRRGEQVSGFLWAVLLLVGLPVGLAHFVGWPLPHHWPTRAGWELWLKDPMADRRTQVDLFAITLWLLWAVLLYAFLTDVAARVRRATRRLARRLRPLPPGRGLLGAAVVGTGTVAVSVVATAHPPVLAATTPTAPDTPAAPAPPGSPAPVVPADEQPATAADRVTLPDGGWVTRQTAAAVAASSAMVWRQRRRHYKPRLLVGVTRDDPDLAPLPATVTTVIQQLQPPPDGPPTPPDPATQAPSRQTAAPATDRVPVVGERVGQPLPLSAVPAGGVGLVGPAAVDAARGVLVAALLSGLSSPARVRVVTTDADLAALLQNTGSAEGVPGLLIADDLMDAVAAVEDLAVDRVARAAREAVPADVSRTVLLAASPADPDTARRVRVLLTLAADKAVTGVLLGGWGPDATWHVGPDGLVETIDGPPARLSVLGAAAAGDLLRIYREAHTRPAPADTEAVGEAGGVGLVRPVRVPRQIPAAFGLPPAAAAAAQAPRTGRVRLTVLGLPAVYRPGEADAVRWPRTAALSALVFLAVHSAGATSTELATALWPPPHQDSTTNRIYNVMSAVHKALDPAGSAPMILRDGERYRLNPQRVDVDLWRLHDAIRAAAEPTTRATALRRVIDTYVGDLADGWPWPWLDPHREATRRQVLDAYTALAADHPEAAAQLLYAAAAVDPDNDALRRRIADTNPQGTGGDVAGNR